MGITLMNAPKDKKHAGSGDWLAKSESGNPNWESELTPEEIIAMNAELEWATSAEIHDWPGPRRIGVMF